MSVERFRVRNQRGASGSLFQDCFYSPSQGIVLHRESDDGRFKDDYRGVKKRFFLAEGDDVLVQVAKALHEGKNPQMYAAGGDFLQSNYSAIQIAEGVSEDDLGKFAEALRVEKACMALIDNRKGASSEEKGLNELAHKFGKYIDK